MRTKAKKDEPKGVPVKVEDMLGDGKVYKTKRGREVILERKSKDRVWLRLVDEPERRLFEAEKGYTLYDEEAKPVEAESVDESPPSATAPVVATAPVGVPLTIPKQKRNPRVNKSGKQRMRKVEPLSARSLCGAEIISLRDALLEKGGLTSAEIRDKVKGEVVAVMKAVKDKRPDLAEITLYTTFYSLVNVLCP